MKVFPAIDLLDSKAVRLRRGRREDATVYSDDPVDLIATYAQAGAPRIHVVDLDGAFTGASAHRDLLARMVKMSRAPIQFGGGIRDPDALEAVFELGVQFAIIGTAAFKNRKFVRKACREHPGRIIIAVDATDDEVAVEGWVESTGVSPLDLATRAVVWGAAGLLYTDVRRDGMRSGPNVPAAAALAHSVEIPVTASGGVSSLEDIRQLAAQDVDSVVVGSALYEHKFTLEEAIAAGDLRAG